jgi:hypothetical protein
MKFQTFSINRWLFPDTAICQQEGAVVLHSARNADACFQILTDGEFPEGTACSWTHTLPENFRVTVLQMLPVCVPHNSSATYHTTDDYESVKDFVIRKAPFDVFDLTVPVDAGLRPGKCAFLVRIDIPAEAAVGVHTGMLTVMAGDVVLSLEVCVSVHTPVLSAPKDAPYGMINWIYPEIVCRLHGVDRFSEEYYRWYERYFEEQIDMRNTHFQLPTGIEVRDGSGKVVDFDFTECERIGKLALKAGFRYIFGGFVAHWNKWKDASLVLLWDRECFTDSMEGSCQLRIYFRRLREMVERNGWQDVYMQGLVDEPQLYNSMSYRALTGLFRREFPGILIIDPVETPDIYGSCDIWVIKQAIYEKYREEYDRLRELGEEYWVYTCGFPAGKWMNRVMDLPLSATRLPVWMSVRYGMTGFLHWGYHAYCEGMDAMKDTCYPVMHHGVQKYFPAGNHSVMYADRDHIYESIRAHLQRLSSEDGELLMRLREKNKDACDAIINSVCTGFENYTTDDAAIDEAHRRLLEALDAC